MKFSVHHENLPTGRSCHSSTVAVMPNGDTFVTWFQGSHEGNPDVAIMGKWFSKNGDGRVHAIAKVNEQPHWNPVVSFYNDKLNLFFRVGQSPQNWNTWIMTSDPLGNYGWGEPKLALFGPVKNKPIQIFNGLMLAGDSTETPTEWESQIHHFEPDNTWVRCVIIPAPHGVGMIQPTLWESMPTHVHAIMRTTVGQLYRSDSIDSGNTWCEAYPIGLPNNNSGVDIVRHGEAGKLTMVWNPIWSPQISGSRRGILTQAQSYDNGETWREERFSTLEQDGGEYSYPAIVIDDEGKLHITYTYNRKNIIYRTF